MKHYNESANAFIETSWEPVGDTSSLKEGDPVEEKQTVGLITLLQEDSQGRLIQLRLYRHELLDLVEHMTKIEEERQTGKFYPLPF